MREGALQHPATTVTDRFPGSQIAYLQNRRLQCTYRAQTLIVSIRRNSVKTYAETNGIELKIGKSRNACRIEDMTQNLMRRRGLYSLGTSCKKSDLMPGIIIETSLIATGEMRKNRPCRPSYLVMTTFRPTAAYLFLRTRVDAYPNRS